MNIFIVIRRINYSSSTSRFLLFDAGFFFLVTFLAVDFVFEEKSSSSLSSSSILLLFFVVVFLAFKLSNPVDILQRQKSYPQFRRKDISNFTFFDLLVSALKNCVFHEYHRASSFQDASRNNRNVSMLYSYSLLDLAT